MAPGRGGAPLGRGAAGRPGNVPRQAPQELQDKIGEILAAWGGKLTLDELIQEYWELTG